MRFFVRISYLTITGILAISFINAQVAAVKFIVKVPEQDTQKNHSLYLAGSFNSWNSHDSLYKMNMEDENTYSLIVPLFDGKTYKYKYTKGNWNTVETKINDSDIANRILYSRNGMVLYDTVVKWKIPASGQQKTLSPQMQKMMAIKDSAAVQLQSMLKDLLVLLKQYNENILSAKPNKRLHKKQIKQTIEIIANVYKTIESKIWEIGTSLSPEQKQKILAAIKNAKAPDDVLNNIKNAYGDALK